jgi:hypothetical protein
MGVVRRLVDQRDGASVVISDHLKFTQSTRAE